MECPAALERVWGRFTPLKLVIINNESPKHKLAILIMSNGRFLTNKACLCSLSLKVEPTFQPKVPNEDNFLPKI